MMCLAVGLLLVTRGACIPDKLSTFHVYWKTFRPGVEYKSLFLIGFRFFFRLGLASLAKVLKSFLGPLLDFTEYRPQESMWSTHWCDKLINFDYYSQPRNKASKLTSLKAIQEISLGPLRVDLSLQGNVQNDLLFLKGLFFHSWTRTKHFQNFAFHSWKRMTRWPCGKISHLLYRERKLRQQQAASP